MNIQYVSKKINLFLFVAVNMVFSLLSNTAFAVEPPSSEDIGYINLINNPTQYEHIKSLLTEKLGVTPERIIDNTNIDMYEILYPDGKIIYLTKNEKYFIDGAVVNLDNLKENITATRTAKSLPYNEKELNFKDAIKTVKGNGSRRLISFEDPNCGYCKKFHAEKEKLDNVTFYTFIIPILGDDSVTKAKNIWCSQDKVKAWNSAMEQNMVPQSKVCDTSALERNIKIAQKFKINGTPTMFFVNGERIPGAVPVEVIEKKLSETTKK